MKRKYTSPSIFIITLTPDVFWAGSVYNTVNSVPSSEALDRDATTVINGGIIGSEVTGTTVYGDSKSSVWDFED